MSATYDLDAYRRFAENLRSALRGKNIKTISLREAHKKAIPSALRTRTGSYCWRSAVSSRMGQKTVYL